MTKYACSLTVYVCLLVGMAQVAAAQTPRAQFPVGQNPAFASWNDAALVKSSYRAGRTAFEIQAPSHVTPEALLEGIDLSKTADPQTLANRVNDNRKALYPDADISLRITPPKGTRAGTPAVGVDPESSYVYLYYRWNASYYSNGWAYGYYWSGVAILFMDDIPYGGFWVYYRSGSRWVYKATVSAGGSYSLANYGSNTYRGFYLDPYGSRNRADWVMWWFR